MNHATLLHFAAIRQDIPGTGIFAQTVKTGPIPEVVKMIKDQLKDNRVLVTEIVGERVVTLIDKLS